MKRIKCILYILLITLLFAGCSGSSASNETDKLQVVTSFYPMYIAALNLTQGVEGATLTNLAPETDGCLHDYQLSPKDLLTLSEADLFIINGGGMESFLDKVTSELHTLEIVNTGEGLEWLTDEHGHVNGHIWLSIPKHMTQVNQMADALKDRLPKEADIITANATRYNEELAALNLEMHEALDGLPRKNIVTFHEAFPYFAESFGLNIVAVIEQEPGSAPSAGELSDIIGMIKANEADAIFAEPQYSQKSAETISAETGMPVYLLDPIVTGEMTPSAYLDAMRQNLETLKKALN